MADETRREAWRAVWVVEHNGEPGCAHTLESAADACVRHGKGTKVRYVPAESASPPAAETLELWAARTLWAATGKDWHISQPYPHKRLGGWELIATPPNGRDQMHHGDTAALCVISAARALCASDPSLPKEPGT